MNLKGRTELFTKDDVIKDSHSMDFTGRILVISPKRLKGFKLEYQTPENQLIKASGGFGCNPLAMGSAVGSTFLSDGESARFERYDFLGILKPELVEEYELEIKEEN